MFSGNRLWLGIGLGAVGATALTSDSNKPFYYGVLAVVVLFKLLGSKVLGKWNTYAILGCIAIFLYTFIYEVILKKQVSTAITSPFASVWNKLKGLIPSASATPSA